MSGDLISFVQAMDRCWLERRFDDLANYIADDVVIVAPDGKTRMHGIDAAIGSYREFMDRSRIRRFGTADHLVTERDRTAVVEYAWTMAWDSPAKSYDESGREVLVLARRAGSWRVIWRMQLPS